MSMVTLSSISSATGDLTGTYPSPSVAARVITWAKTQAVGTARILGRKTAGSGDVEELTGTDVAAMLPTFGASARGLVPAAAGSPSSTKYLSEDGSFTTPAGGGGSAAGASSTTTPRPGSVPTTTTRCRCLAVMVTSF